jgi:hypothetical protein
MLPAGGHAALDPRSQPFAVVCFVVDHSFFFNRLPLTSLRKVKITIYISTPAAPSITSMFTKLHTTKQQQEPLSKTKFDFILSEALYINGHPHSI